MPSATSHVIYGLFQEGAPRNILYIGSATLDGMPARYGQHLHGECRTTKMGAAKQGIALATLRMRVLCLWRHHSPEGHILALCRGVGMARWNFPHTVSSEASRRGGCLGGLASVANGHPAKVNGGRIGGPAAGHKRTHEQMVHMRTLEGCQKGARNMPIEARRRGGRVGGKLNGPIAGRIAKEAGRLKTMGTMGAHNRWHVNRGIISPACSLCVPR
jgi:hypothetical protein